jgi:hypothetical protein
VTKYALVLSPPVAFDTFAEAIDQHDPAATPSLATGTRSTSSTTSLPGFACPVVLGCWLRGRRRQDNVTMTTPPMHPGVNHHRTAVLVPPRWLAVFPPALKRGHLLRGVASRRRRGGWLSG